MNTLQIFNNSSFGEIRTMEENGKILFCGSDVARALGYTRPTKAIQDHCKGVLKQSTLTNGGNQLINFIPEGDLYRLITHSKLPSAEQFETWVFDEVLPSIRQTGTYAHENLSVELQAIIMHDKKMIHMEKKIDVVEKDLNDFKLEMPLLAVECEKITKSVKSKGVVCLGGKNSSAYHNPSLRNKVYSDIYSEVKRQFGVTSYKAIKRNECNVAVELVNRYQLPMVLENEIGQYNSQLTMAK